TVVSMIYPDSDEMIHIDITPREVASIPQGWWHYISATADNTHLLSTFDTPLLQTIFGSQILKIMPKDSLSYMYCLDEKTVGEALSPIDEKVIIGPPSDCAKSGGTIDNQNMKEQNIVPEKAAKPTWQPYAPPFPGAFYPKR